MKNEKKIYSFFITNIHTIRIILDLVRNWRVGVAFHGSRFYVIECKNKGARKDETTEEKKNELKKKRTNNKTQIENCMQLN